MSARSKVFQSYVCESCGGTFDNAWSGEEVFEEYKNIFHEEPTPEKDAIVCDECYKAIMGLN